MDSTGNFSGIAGLKDFGIKVSALDGKYTIEYDLSKPVQNVGKVDGITDATPDVADL